MPTVKVKLVEAGAGAITNVAVRLWHFGSAGPYPIESGKTDSTGAVAIDVSLLSLGEPFLQLRAENAAGRELWRSSTFSAPLPLQTEDLGVITLQGADLRGLLVTNQTGTVARLAANNRTTILVDNAVAWAEVETSVQAARSSLLLQMFYFDVNNVFLRFNPDPPAPNVATTGVRLEELLLTANRLTPPVSVRILNRFATPTSYPTHTADVVRKFFADHAPNTVALRDFKTSARFPMHAKFIVVDDGTGFIVGSPFLQEYFDAKTHSIGDSRRGRMSSSLVDGALGGGVPGGSLKNSVRAPIHDVSCKIAGPAVAHMRDTFFLHWDLVGIHEGSPVTIPNDPAPNSAMQIVRSLPGSTFAGLPIGERGVLEAYMRVFQESTEYVYLENQYLLNLEIVSGLRLALKRAPNLEVILILNIRLDLPGYNLLQRSAIQQLKAALTADSTANRLGVFCLWHHESATLPRIIRGYVHSKVGIVDDKWATIGSANLDGASLHTGEASLPLVPEDEHQRAIEVNAVFLNGVAGQPASSVPSDLRRNLWAEHLGLSQSDPSLATRPAAGWLSLWNAAAQRKLNGLKTNPSVVAVERILPWLPETDQENFLKASGVDVRKFDVVDEVPSFDFNTGKPIAP
jgi:phosphatidylserine/phosphatidylglycerophosphate/cardiolipin synthase-like enzyme